MDSNDKLKTHNGNVELVDHMGNDLSVVNAARVSFDKESCWKFIDFDNDVPKEDEYGIYYEDELQDKDKKLIKYLAEHNHWSPFSHPQISLRIKMPIFIARQWFKHTVGFARNEMSRRYVDSEPEFWDVKEWRGRAEDKKQGSSGIVKVYETTWGGTEYHEILSILYNDMIKQGIAPEMARQVLPQSMMTEFIETGSLYAYARLFNLRSSSDAQLESQWYAGAVGEILSELFPESWEVLTNG